MSKLKVTILNPGIQSTIQDHGRKAFHSFGVPVSGPLDRYAAAQANRLVGNPDSNSLLEFTLIGPEVELDGHGLIVITGGSFPFTVNDKPASANQAIEVKGRTILKIGKANLGCRGYLAISGSWLLDPWLDSCSTSPQFGNHLTAQSVMEKGSAFLVEVLKLTSSSPFRQRIDIGDNIIRVLAGPEYHALDTDVIVQLFEKEFKISPQSNRMGFRMENPVSGYRDPIELISSGVVPGTIQLMPSGHLIVLMADAQTTGGYPRIAHVIQEDQDKLAQMKPGGLVRFGLISLKEAHALLTKQI